jgi:DNA mismatch endonuclease (patch repair protein)
VDDKTLPGYQDFVFHKPKVTVFADGDFWHGWRFPVWQHRLSSFWREKVAQNRARDVRNLRTLKRLGWKSIRIWEHQIEEDVMECVRRIVRELAVDTINWKRVRDVHNTLPPLKRRNRLPKP